MIREKLTRKTADRHAAARRGFITRDRVVKRLEDESIFKDARKRFFENRVIDRIEIFADVFLKKETARTRMARRKLERRRLSAPFAACAARVKLNALERRLANVHERVACDSVTNRRDLNLAFFRIEDRKRSKRAPTIRAGRKVGRDPRQFVLESRAETLDVTFATFAAYRLKPCKA